MIKKNAYDKFTSIYRLQQHLMESFTNCSKIVVIEMTHQ